MREILFRAKTTSTPEWVEGYYTFDGTHWIDHKLSIERPEYGWVSTSINPETLGQFTGLYDKKGVRIFEGDIIEGFDEFTHWDSGRVYWDERRCQFVRTAQNPYCSSFPLDRNGMYEVIGNIYDNPELLEETNEKIKHIS